MQKQLERLIAKHGLLEVLEVLGSIAAEKAKAVSKVGKRRRYNEYKVEAWSQAQFHNQAAREIRRAIGSLRQYRPTDEPVKRPRGDGRRRVD